MKKQPSAVQAWIIRRSKMTAPNPIFRRRALQFQFEVEPSNNSGSRKSQATHEARRHQASQAPQLDLTWRTFDQEGTICSDTEPHFDENTLLEQLSEMSTKNE